jgi:hypothetical protein
MADGIKENDGLKSSRVRGGSVGALPGRIDAIRTVLYYSSMFVWAGLLFLALAHNGRGTLIPWVGATTMICLIGGEWAFGRWRQKLASDDDSQAHYDPERKCVNCDYLLVGLTSNRCPECNWAFDPNSHTESKPEERILWQSSVRMMVAAILLSGYVLALGAIGREMRLVAMGLTGIATVVFVTFVVGVNRMRGYKVSPADSFACRPCGYKMKTPIGNQCVECGCEILTEDVFTPVLPWNLLDWRYRRLRRGLLAWLALVNGGLLVAAIAAGWLWFQGVTIALSLGRGMAASIMTVVMIGVWVARKTVYDAYNRRHRLLFGMAAPTCSTCFGDLCGQPPNGACPNCESRYDSRRFTGSFDPPPELAASSRND